MDLTKLNGIIPASVVAQIPLISDKFQINTSLRLSHFLAQCMHESGSFSVVNENLNYSAQGLLNTFHKYFDANSANVYARHPDKIGSHVYANRNGNGAEATGEGYKFRGRGYIQLTGKANYQLFSTSVGEDCVANPDLVSSKYPLASAAWFFQKNGINQVSDQGSSVDIVTVVTKRVNGGTNGLTERINFFNKIYKALN